MKKILIWLGLSLLPICAIAEQRTGLGGVATNLMEPVTLFSNLVQLGCILIGGSFLFASLVKYFEHRRSPLMIPISTVIFLLIGGLLLILLPFLSMLTEHGLPHIFTK